MRKSFLALAAMIAAAACTDTTSPVTPPSNASVDSVATPAVNASFIASSTVFSGYSLSSHHWTHIKTFMTDYYYSWTDTERRWAGAHYDVAMSGSISAWKSSNPTVQHLTYALLWTTTTTGDNLATGFYPDMQRWYRAHPQYSFEKAFVHRAGASFSSSGRVTYSHWGTTRWAINPGDAGAVAYTVSRIQRLVSPDGGIFFDEASTGDMRAHLGTMQEYSSSDYTAAIGRLLGAIKNGVGLKMLMLNTAEYTTPQDSINAARAGAVHLEMFNNFKYSGMAPRWTWIEHLATSGVFVDVVSAYNSSSMASMATYYPRGNSPTNVQRAKLWELASYYIGLPTSGADRVAIQLENTWGKAYSTIWTKAQEANVGRPLSQRVLQSSGTDPYGNRYQLWVRDFERARIVLRLQQGWGSQTYTDGTAITVALPSGERWIPLNADATIESPVTSVRLRNSEAAILFKGSKL
ncbi:MAG: hypothetical protein ABI889_00085 [Gemmatimonadota bacterium]